MTTVVISIPIGLFSLLAVSLTAYNYFHAKKIWNGGVCAENGLQWSWSNEGRCGFLLRANDEYRWIEFPPTLFSSDADEQRRLGATECDTMSIFGDSYGEN